MYDFYVDEFPLNLAHPVTRSVSHGCEGCRRLNHDYATPRKRRFGKARANRASRRTARQILHTWDRAKTPRMFTCWDII